MGLLEFMGRTGHQSVFDSLSQEYDAWYDSKDGRPLYLSELDCLNHLVGPGKRRILEIGVGTGRFAMHFPCAVGVDSAYDALTLAKKRNIRVMQGCGETLPLKDETFDCILIVLTLCFVHRPVDLILEAKRVLLPGGRIILGIVPKDSPWGAFYEEKKRRGHPFYRHATLNSLEDTQKLLRNTGMIILRIRSTLLQSPEGPPKVEDSIEGYDKHAGFLCIEAKKRP